MDYEFKNTWVFVKPTVKADGVYVDVMLGKGTLMDDGTVKRRPQNTIATLGPYTTEQAGIAAGKAHAEEWLNARPSA